MGLRELDPWAAQGGASRRPPPLPVPVLHTDGRAHAASARRHGGGGGLARRSLDAAFAQEKGRAGDRAAAAAAAPRDGLMARSHTVSNPCDVGEMLEHINTCKLAGKKPPCAGEAAAALARAASGGPTTITDGTNRNFKWIQPSGAPPETRLSCLHH